MTLASEIISDAYRETNLIPLGVAPNANQITEALNRLNPIVLSCVGNEAGDELKDLNYGGDNDQSSFIVDWIPDNTRLVFNNSAAVTLDADPEPYEGQRLAFVDNAGNLNTYNVIISGNGRKIEGASSITLSVNSDARQWLYRADTGNWVKINALASGDTMPFPAEYNDYFVIALAVRLNPRYGQSLSSESFETYKRTRSQIRARYRRKTFDIQCDPGLVSRRQNYGWGFNGFDTGSLWPWGAAL